MDVIKALGYLRVSGMGQVDGEGFPRQRAAIEAHAAANGMEIVQWFEEKGVSGTTEWENRPAWISMMLTTNGIHHILVERLDRVSRSLLVQEHILLDLKKRGIVLVSTAEPNLDSDDPTRVLMRHVLGAVAQFDRCQIVLKLRDARRRVKARTGRCEGVKPFGALPGESATVTEIQAMAADGLSLRQIAAKLNHAGHRPRKGATWGAAVIGRILKRSAA